MRKLEPLAAKSNFLTELLALGKTSFTHKCEQSSFFFITFDLTLDICHAAGAVGGQP